MCRSKTPLHPRRGVQTRFPEERHVGVCATSYSLLFIICARRCVRVAARVRGCAERDPDEPVLLQLNLRWRSGISVWDTASGFFQYYEGRPDSERAVQTETALDSQIALHNRTSRVACRAQVLVLHSAAQRGATAQPFR
ncbi:hypothetical protein BDW22DRAFT_65807 [Trametopsis cervina]|nr:hypothetical protein BDW22DRAFT_65807 [Trametopsis cervina]